MDTTHGFEPKLKKQHTRPSYTNVPWITVDEVVDGQGHNYPKPKLKRKLLLERWGHVPIIKNCLALIECHKRTIELMEELLMSLLTRLDWNKPIVKDQADTSAVMEKGMR